MSFVPCLRRHFAVTLLTVAAASLLVAADYEPLPSAALSGGSLTVADAGATAYLQPAAALGESGPLPGFALTPNREGANTLA